MHQPHLPFAALAAVCTAAAFAETVDLEVFGRVEVIDAVDCTKTDHDFVERPAGVSTVTNLLGSACRWIPVQDGETASLFSYRLGKGKGLKANGSYVVVLEYPDDVPRNYVLHNRSTDSRRGFSTGRCLGDAWEPAYVDNHPESVDIPQSGRWERWTCYGSLTDLTPDAVSTEVDKKPVLHRPEDGFDFVVSQYSRRHAPASHGVAVRRILLCEIPDERACYAPLSLPPAPLPVRRLFWREEMSDNGAINGERGRRHCNDQLDWLRHKCRQMKMLGLNTFMKDLLEFGHVQHWDPNVIRVNWAWGGSAESNALWERTVDMVSQEFGFAILPYYEWYGNLGGDWKGRKSYGYRRLCEPLGEEKSYTHIWWTEHANLDVTDPEALSATKDLLKGTIVRFKDRAAFAGALFRARPASWPVGFGEATRARFAREANGGAAVTKEALRRDKALYGRYVDWWHGKRRAFVKALGDYLASEGIAGAQVLFDGEGSEPGPGFAGPWALVTDSPDFWRRTFTAAGIKVPAMRTAGSVAAEHGYLASRNRPADTWGKWEWQHASPADRPGDLPKDARSAYCMPVNRRYSVLDPDAFAAYADANGMTTLIRHHPLNEHMQKWRKDGKDVPILGYEMNDSERAGRASMQIEVEAMAHGDVANIGYLIGSTFSRGFPGPVREFNRNFLALPALPSRVVAGACDDPEVTLREIDCTRQGAGRYFYLVHTGRTAKRGVKVRFPAGVASVTFPVDGGTRRLDGRTLAFDELRPWQLLAIRSE